MKKFEDLSNKKFENFNQKDKLTFNELRQTKGGVWLFSRGIENGHEGWKDMYNNETGEIVWYPV
ncbi:MAG: hypothetical protein B6I20_02095 [Bacteroidetes bacterium 4572_117]|nr:MAG: hypothetical protein B6I20_02095 [Bacteroidetes bacterium 4572_117]